MKRIEPTYIEIEGHPIPAKIYLERRAQFKENEHLKTRFFPKLYQTGDVLKVGERSYTLVINHEERSTSTARLKNGQIQLKLNKDLNSIQLSKSIKTLLSRVVGKDFKKDITKRVLEINEQFFKKDIKSVKQLF